MARQQTQKTQKKTHEEHIAEIWKMFKRSQQAFEKSQQEFEKSRQESKERERRFDRMLEQSKRESDKRFKKLDELFTGQWGKLIESLVEGDLVRLLKQKGIKVEATATHLEGEYKGERGEIDIMAINGREVVVVEVKTTLKKSDVDHFIKKLKIFKNWRTEYKDKTIYGAVAYLKKQAGVDVFAEKEGLFVIRATGSSASITNKENFKPKSFPLKNY